MQFTFLEQEVMCLIKALSVIRISDERFSALELRTLLKVLQRLKEEEEKAYGA